MQNQSDYNSHIHFPLAVECEPRFSQLAAPVSIICQFPKFLIFLFLFQFWMLYFHFLKRSFLLLGVSVFWFCLLNPEVLPDSVYLWWNFPRIEIDVSFPFILMWGKNIFQRQSATLKVSLGGKNLFQQRIVLIQILRTRTARCSHSEGHC